MEKLDLKCIKDMILQDKFIISNHARTRMFQRNISTDKLIEVVNNEVCHVVVADCIDHARIITVYYPAKDKWIEDRIRIDKQ